MSLFICWVYCRNSWGNSKAMFSRRHSTGNELLILLRSLRFCQVTLLRWTFSKLQSRDRVPAMNIPIRNSSHRHFWIMSGMVLIFCCCCCFKLKKIQKMWIWQWCFKYSFTCLYIPEYLQQEEFSHSSFYSYEGCGPFLCLQGFFFFFLFHFGWLCWLWKWYLFFFFFFLKNEQSITIVLPWMPGWSIPALRNHHNKTDFRKPKAESMHLLTHSPKSVT